MTYFKSLSGVTLEKPIDFWEPIVITKEMIDAEVQRLAALPRPLNGRRESLIVHPDATEPGLGLAPGIQVKLSVLKPGEESAPFRHNATEVNFCIGGSGYSVIGGKRTDFNRYDVWNSPSYAVYRHANNGSDLQVRLTYSNVSLLQKLNVYIAEENPPLVQTVETRGEEKGREDPRRKSPYGTFQLNEDGAWMMPYETLINPDAVESRPLHWPWAEVQHHLDKLEALGKDYIGRRLYMMYNTCTGRTNGCTPNFFATMCMRPAKIVDRPHRHVSAAINYYFQGRGRSTVQGKVYEWKAGDLMLSAPGWAVHNHASYDETVYELTVQDQPLHIYMESLLWQEDLKLPVAVLGSEIGFGTNRAAAVGGD